MPDDIAIKVEGLYKTFKLPHEKTGSIKSAVVNFYKRKKGYEKQQALKNVSFEVKKGEFFGIVGRNGSGKSTLLKLLAGIYTPDKGDIQINGKLTPFIELGVGFNPELSGRDNVYLNGALLGFNRKEMEAMYDEIVEFAELERFMDQKLKNYSSGMQVRLAFSIAIRAQSDILVLDEVLAVGDEAFQRKCNDYFQLIKEDKTKTVILVTHSMENMQKFCDRALLLRNGEIIINGSPEEVANQYTEDSFESLGHKREKSSGSKLGLSERVPHLRVIPKSKRVLSHKDDLIFDIEYEITDDEPVSVSFSIMDEKRRTYILANGAKPISGKGKHKLTYIFPLALYNDADLYITAVLDEAKTRKRIAFTGDENPCRFAIRNKESDRGLLRKDNDIHGHWVDWEEYSYNNKELE